MIHLVTMHHQEMKKGMDQQDERNYDFPLDNLTAIDKVRVQGENCQICREDEASLKSKSGQEIKDSESKTIDESKKTEEHTKPWWWFN